MNMLYPLPAHYGALLALCMAGLLVLWWFMLGSHYFTRRHLLRRRIQDLATPSEDTAAFEPLAEPRTAVARAREQLLCSPTLHGLHQPLYELPWLLFIGDDDAGLPALLTAAHGQHPLPPGQVPDEGDDLWRWHFLPHLVAIEMRSTAVHEPATPHERGRWYRALLALSEQRERLPLNGIVVCVNAARLLGHTQHVGTDAARLRRRVDEAAELLRLQLPIYLLVTGLERLVGYQALLEALPLAVRNQALGHRLPDTAAAVARPDALFEPLVLRLHALRMGLLRRQPDPARRQSIHAFVEQVRALQPGLRTFAQQLFGAPRSGHAGARWRGLYLVAAPNVSDQSAFVSDIFQRFLPADQPLAR